jgi:hypothetical protein
VDFYGVRHVLRFSRKLKGITFEMVIKKKNWHSFFREYQARSNSINARASFYKFCEKNGAQIILVVVSVLRKNYNFNSIY